MPAMTAEGILVPEHIVHVFTYWRFYVDGGKMLYAHSDRWDLVRVVWDFFGSPLGCSVPRSLPTKSPPPLPSSCWTNSSLEGPEGMTGFGPPIRERI